MTRLLEVTEKLNEANRQKLIALAESLLAGQTDEDDASTSTLSARKIRFERWAGYLSHVDPNRTDKELLKEAWDEVICKHDRPER